MLNGVCIEEEPLVAETFNNYFIEKINDLKDGIDQTIKRDPLEKLAAKMKNNCNKFYLKKISLSKLAKIMKKIKKKKSARIDGLGQDQLILGSKTLTAPLNIIINESIKTGIFPEDWKEAKVTPILKKVALKQ